MISNFVSGSYWDTRYRSGGNSGAGSYGHLARYKAGFLNRFVLANRVRLVGELGCGDGSQISRALYPEYVGYDVSIAAVDLCKQKFMGDSSKSFYCLNDVKTLCEVDLGLSLDVVYHLIEDVVYGEYLRQLFRMSARFVIIYGNGCVRSYGATHVRLRDFTKDVRDMFPDWKLIACERNPYYSHIGSDPNKSWSNFYVYETRPKSWHPVLIDKDIWTTTVDLSPDQIFMTPDEYKDYPISSWQSLIENCRTSQIVSLSQKFDLDEIAVAKPVISGYLLEILPEMIKFGLSSRSIIGETTPIGITRKEPILFVSLTCIKSRIVHLKKVIFSILSQSRVPDKIILNISEEPYLLDEGIPRDKIPEDITFLEEAGLLEINYVNNTGPYRKLLPTLAKYWDFNCVIVTADDDTVYPAFWLDELYKTYLSDTSALVSRRVVRMAMQDGRPLPYLEWAGAPTSNEVPRENLDWFLVPTGKDGILYSPRFFTKAVFDPEIIRLCPTSDDFAFRLMTMITRTKVNIISKKLSSSGTYDEYHVVDGSNDGLWANYNLRGGNDKNLKNILSYLFDNNMLDINSFMLPGFDIDSEK